MPLLSIIHDQLYILFPTSNTSNLEGLACSPESTPFHWDNSDLFAEFCKCKVLTDGAFTAANL